jgi:SAM-dependent methyltransferase
MDWHKRFLQQAGWTGDLRHYLFEKAGLSHALRVLEVGCGTGAILVDIKGPGNCFGLDLDAGRLKEARQHAAEARLVCGDALRLPFPSESFDITCCHYLLLWVGDPLQALREMKRVTHSGGSVLALAEPDHSARVDEPAALAVLGRWQTEALRRLGADTSLGGRLGHLFEQAGIRLVETGLIRGEGKQLMENKEWKLEWEVLEADLAGMIASEEVQELKRLDEIAWQQGVRILYVPTYFAHGVV